MVDQYFVRDTDKVLIDFLDEIDSVSGLDALFSALEKAALRLGYDSISYTYIPSIIGAELQKTNPVFKLSNSYNTKFIEHYASEGFAEKDFTIKRIKSGNLAPMNWWSEADNKTLSSDEKRVIEVARIDYGIRHGVSIPTYSDGHNMAGISVTSADPDQQFSLLCAERMSVMRRIARIFNDRVLVMPQNRATFFLPLLDKMTHNEKVILQQLAMGKPLKVIATDLGLSYRYATNVIERLRSKLGNVSRDQLLYLAGMIQFHALVI